MSLYLGDKPEVLREKFNALQTRYDIADLLEVKYEHLNYYLYVANPTLKYTVFSIPKAQGGVREISAPATALKIVQIKLAQVLKCVYQPKPSVYGFLDGRNIVLNAKRHIRKKYVLNVDLASFFPSINFGRVRGMFLAIPYQLNAEVATVLAQICCFNNLLPQGAPTSPIVSNMICAKLDGQLQRLAKKYKCTYTRYANDLTFSTFLPVFPSHLAALDPLGNTEVGDELNRVITENGFKINPDKIRLQSNGRRQEVTGITVNKKTNVTRQFIRQIRAMLHAWEKYGLEAAEIEFRNKYDEKYRGPFKEPPLFKMVVKGKIDFLGMVRGKADFLYQKLLAKYAELDTDFEVPQITPQRQLLPVKPIIFTEGKTDRKHLRNALSKLKASGYFNSLELGFDEGEDDRGDQELLNMCNTFSKIPQSKIMIFIFDRDNEILLKKVTDDSTGYKFWGNQVYSFSLPVPKHRVDTPQISIEFYYQDQEIKRADAQGRRLFLNSEFNPKSGRHNSKDLNCIERTKLQRSTICIVDNSVFNSKSENVALPKNDFADNIINGITNFDDFDVIEFSKIFDVISRILQDTNTMD